VPFFAYSFFLVLADLLGVVDRILQEQRRLSKEEESAENELFRIHAQLVRLRRQKRLLFQKGKKMVSENLANMDEVEEAEQSEEATRGSSIAVPSVVESGSCAAGPPGLDVDWSSLGLELSSPDANWLASVGLDCGGGSPQASGGNA
jgi:hypothetical protein